jgi:hypothetical protein
LQGWLILVAVLALGLSSCQRRPSCESEDATATVAALATRTPVSLNADQVEQLWTQGVHADTFVEDEEGRNSSCARCHAPMHWQPLSSELPTSWAQNGLTGLSTQIHISESDWSQISCEICHPQVREDVDGEIGWLEIPPMAIYMDVDTSSQLCGYCHLAETNKDHIPFRFEGVHAQLSCIDCHDAHDGSASCGTSTCHQPFAQECIEIETHDKPHSEVTCGGCHDGLGLPIGWNEEIEKWDTFYGGDPRVERAARPFNSHNLVLEVDCDRCHAPGDHPWDPKE